MRSSARPSPTMRGSRTVPPSISGTPQRRQNTPEHGVLLDHPQVAPQRQLHAAGDRVTADRGDHRLATAAAGTGPSARRRMSGVERVRHRVQVRTGAERAAGAPQHRHRRRVVGLERAERLGQRLRGRAVHGIAAPPAGREPPSRRRRLARSGTTCCMHSLAARSARVPLLRSLVVLIDSLAVAFLGTYRYCRSLVVSHRLARCAFCAHALAAAALMARDLTGGTALNVWETGEMCPAAPRRPAPARRVPGRDGRRGRPRRGAGP